MELEVSIEDLLNKQRVESDRIEFKTGFNPDEIYHSVCAFANDFNNEGGGAILLLELKKKTVLLSVLLKACQRIC